MFIDESGKGIHRDLRMKGSREEISFEIVKSLLKKGEVVLEAGANIGYYTIMESKKVGEKGLVYAVEPIKENYNLLKKNITLNKLENVKTYNLGFSNTEGILNINVSEDSNLNTPANIEGREKSSVRIEKVKCLTLDNFFKNKRKPNFMRMDIEGYEDVVFEGGSKILDSLDKIFVELHFPLVGEERMIKLLNNLKSKGFEIHKAVMEWERLEDERVFTGRFTNWLYKKRSKPVIYEGKKFTIENLIKNKDFIKGHLSLEVFFIKKK